MEPLPTFKILAEGYSILPGTNLSSPNNLVYLSRLDPATVGKGVGRRS
jgi:hypothetical protein